MAMMVHAFYAVYFGTISRYCIISISSLMAKLRFWLSGFANVNNEECAKALNNYP